MNTENSSNNGTSIVDNSRTENAVSVNNDLDILRDFFHQGGTLQALMDMAPDDLDQVYAYACQLFDAGDYASAKRFYLMLCRFSHWQFDYWLALGLTCQRLNEQTEAVFCFGQAGLLKLDDPRSSYLAGLSYQLMGNTALAHKAFSASAKWCSDKPEYTELKAELFHHMNESIL